MTASWEFQEAVTFFNPVPKKSRIGTMLVQKITAV